MRPVFQYAARTLSDCTALTFCAARPGAASIPRKSKPCFQSQFRTISRPSKTNRPSTVSQQLRRISSTARALQDKPASPQPDSEPRKSPSEVARLEPAEPVPREPSAASSSTEESSKPPQTPEPEHVQKVPDEQLPSHRQGLRWEIYKRLSAWMDDMLPKLILVGQKVNSFTGTDYSGIEALRREIHQQERLVKARRAQVDAAKSQLETALAQQTASQKEVVGLLERKHSWSASDLERYMSLIRSEHLNEQAVRNAKEAVQSADHALEEARAHLEKRERAQYHEEQIWSDTIRRNSTWVTFGLMGVNILLLLSQLVVIEPWRRRRLVREIKTALDERTMASPVPVAAAPASTVATKPTSGHAGNAAVTSNPADPTVEKDIDSVVEPAGVRIEDTEPKPLEPKRLEPVQDPESGTFTVSVDPSGPETTVPIREVTPSGGSSIPRMHASPESLPEKVEIFVKDCKHRVHELFSEKIVSVRKIDVTTAALQGAAAGAVLTGAIVMAIINLGAK
ncbi:Mdm33 family-domain-containing protein [Phyllosticta citrichinensis]|uniref:Sensitive to high expression protein 9, mitochondrial n=1 Tax=Phyllosticta citrichinensis TaxID=1130410 RepID=A0ABR1XNT9_9PEZI